MFREMRRKKQLLSSEETSAVLYGGISGVLALAGDDDYPYAVPISYVYDGCKLFFHCAKSGHKLDALQRCQKASFCVIAQNDIVPEEYTVYYRSVIVFGKIRVLEKEPEKREAMEKLAVKYAPHDHPAGRRAAIDREWASLCVLEMSIDHMTGKEAIELTRQK
jgi:nitroimidazol reductase NimA-like FMN-containing flavoprotein (pyridoxamine 5'-phosphate oxidase superfamily)